MFRVSGTLKWLPIKLFVYVEVEPSDVTFFETNTNSFTAYAVKLFVHIEVELT
jgi:hypothetical protein